MMSVFFFRSGTETHESPGYEKSDHPDFGGGGNQKNSSILKLCQSAVYGTHCFDFFQFQKLN